MPISTILAVDTSTLKPSVALCQNRETLAHLIGNPNQHCEELIGLIDNCLRQASLDLKKIDRFAICGGPGSFTGLRIGMATLKGLAFANQKSLVSLSSLESIANDMVAIKNNDNAIYCSVLDARREEIFVAFYNIKKKRLNRLGEEHVMKPSNLKDLVDTTTNHAAGPLYLGGNGLEKFPELKELGEVLSEDILVPNAVTLANMAESQELSDDWHIMGPTYIRKSEAEIKFPDGNTGGTFSPRKY